MTLEVSAFGVFGLIRIFRVLFGTSE